LTGRVAAALFAAAVLVCATGADAQETPVVRIPFPQEDGSLTPYTFELGYPLLTLVYDTLTWRDENGIPQPWLARSLRRSDDGLRVDVELRRGARWHDGRPLTSADVVFTFRHLRERPHPRFTPQLADLVDVQATSPYAVAFFLERPSLGFADQPLADVPIVPRHLWEGLAPNRLAPPGLPVGSGPYRLVQHRRGRGYRFVANRRYFRGPPAVGALEVPIIRRAGETFEALRERRVDAIPVSLPEEAATELDGLGVRLAEGTSFLGTVLMLNAARTPFDRRVVRQAVSRALDLTVISRAVDARPGRLGALPAERGYLHPESRWAARGRLHRFTPAQVRVVLAELGVPPFQVLAAKNDPLRVEAGRQVVLALRRAGAQARLREVRAEALSRAVGQNGFAPSFQAAIWSSPPLTSYDPAFLRAVFGDPLSMPLNYSGYRSSVFERLADRVAAAPTRSARRAAVAAQLRLLARDAPVVPLFFGGGAFAYRPAVYDGWVYVKGTGILDKRSFLPSVRPGEAPPQPVGSPLDDPDDGFSLLPFILAAAALLLGGVIWRLASNPR
jgi:peptide/nickel transport system substrate-binding protein